MKGQQDDTCADRVRSDFLARYKWPDNEPELKNKWMTTLEACCTKLASEAIYDLRIYAVMTYKTEIEEEIIEFEAAKLIHLHAHEYRQVPFSWINIDAWNELYNWWGLDKFRTVSAMKRGARLSRPETMNCGGSRSVTRTQQCLEATYGRPFSLIEGFAVHMGASKQAVAEGDGTELPPLTNERAQEHLDNYRDGMRQVYGENVEWVRAPFDAQVMYDNTGRKPHGKFAIADGAVDSSEVQFSTNARPSQSQSSIQRERELVQQVQDVKRQRQEDRNLFCEALLKFNEDMAQYMRQGCANAPPPQINLASLFPDHVQPSESGSMGNSSVNATLPRTGGSRSCQQAPPNIYQQGTMENNFVDVVSQRMNGSSFNHATGQTFSAFLQQVGIGNGFDNMELQRMDGSNFRYATEQATPNTSRHESMQNYSRNVSVERMGRSATGNEGTSTNNYHNSQMRDRDENEDGVFF